MYIIMKDRILCICMLIATVYFIGLSGDVHDMILPMWSRGFSASCCDVYPSTIKSRGFFEHGSTSDPSYYGKATIKSGDRVYIVTSDLPDFILNYFTKLDKSIRITLVTGCEDIGSPYEIFHPNRPQFFDYRMVALWPRGQKDMNMENFLADERLERWYLQNYDGIGCNLYTCSSLNATTDKLMLDKLHPIPIGMDFHTYGALPAMMIQDGSKKLPELTAPQLSIIQAIQAIALSYHQRLPVSLVSSFDCSFDRSKIGQARMRSRGVICQVLQHDSFKQATHSNRTFAIVDGITISDKDSALYVKERRIVLSQKVVIARTTSATQNMMKSIIIAHNKQSSDRWGEKELRRIGFWMTLSMSRYSVAPPGFGIDTHRLWEIMVFGCIPIVITSPLDKLYSQFPIIILKRWDELLEVGVVARFDREINQRYGDNPMMNDTVRHMLTLDYWVELVKSKGNS